MSHSGFQPRGERPTRRRAPSGSHPAPRRLRRAGLTLAELTVSLGIIATLMATIGSVMMLTGHAVGMSASHAAEARIDDVIATIAAEQRLALNVTEYTPKSITFTVADRTGDDVPDTIRYAWSGVVNDPLTRQVNGGAPSIVVANVRSFSLTYLTRTAAAGPTPETLVESTVDEVVYAHETGVSTPSAVSGGNWSGQYFFPTLSVSDARSWRVTQVQVKMSRISATASAMSGKSFLIRLYTANAAGQPTGLTPIEERTLPMSSLTTTMGWSPVVTFSTNTQLDPNQGYCIVVAQPLLTTSYGSVGFENNSSDGKGMFDQYSTLTGWGTPSTTRDMQVRVFGRYTHPAP